MNCEPLNRPPLGAFTHTIFRQKLQAIQHQEYLHHVPFEFFGFILYFLELIFFGTEFRSWPSDCHVVQSVSSIPCCRTSLSVPANVRLAPLHIYFFLHSQVRSNIFPSRHAECHNNQGTKSLTPGITMQSLIQIPKLGAMPLAASSSPALSRTERTSIVGCEYHTQSFVDPATVRRVHSRLL